jgi:cytochrome-b5 reductase
VEDKAKHALGKTGSSEAAHSAFTGNDQGWISLKLESVKPINHNTKRFRFALPDKDDVSGLVVTSALLTKYKGPEMEKAVIRPYTAVSDEGTSLNPALSI